MAVGSVWYKKTAGTSGDTWVQGMPHTKDSTGAWQVGKTIYEKTGASTWTVRYTGDVTPPAAPTYQITNQADLRTVTNVIHAPADADTVQICNKISKTGYPVNPGTQDSNSFTDVQTDGSVFWLYTVEPGDTNTRVHSGMVSGQKYYQSVWAKDAAGNWSAPTNYTWTFPYPTTTTKTLTTKSAYIGVLDSGSYRSNYGWRTDNNYVYQGGPDNFQGFWFYGTNIATALANAHSVTKMEIEIQRSSTAAGVGGDANIMLGHHNLTSQPSGSPGSDRILGEYNAVDLTRGESKWVTIYSPWYQYFQSGYYRGLGLQYGTTSVESSYYAICYGDGTNSGRLKLTWTEYV